MHKTTMVVNDKKLARARKVLGTKGIRDTYEAALDEAIASKEGAHAIDRLLRLEGIDRRVLLRARDVAWRYVARHDPDALVRRINEVVAATDTSLDPVAREAARRILKRTEWAD